LFCLLALGVKQCEEYTRFSRQARMIVICTKCRAKFRVPDEKIGPRGAKVRCSQCHSVFAVQPDAAAARSAQLAPALQPVRTQPSTAAPAAVPPPLPDPPPSGPPPLPVAAASDDPFAPSAARSADPFADDPFLQAEATASAAVPAAAPEPPPPALAAPDVGLALEERVTPPPARVAAAPVPEPPLEVAFGAAAAIDRPASGASAFADFDLATASAEGTLEMAGAAAAGESPPPPSGHAPVVAEPRPRAPAAAPASRPAAPEPAERKAESPGSRVRAVVVNAVSLAALLLVTLAILVVWKADGPIEPGALRPASILGVLRGAEGGPFVASDVRGGVYERERAPPLLFVRGNVVSRAREPVGPLEVSVAVMRGAEVLARGAAIAGALPTAEELYGAGDAAALVAVAATARSRAPAVVRPGDTLPFLVAIGDAPGDLEGAAIRVEIAPGGAVR
jgi:predicted Zn finger-like uncharacterized protein